MQVLIRKGRFIAIGQLPIKIGSQAAYQFSTLFEQVALRVHVASPVFFDFDPAVLLAHAFAARVNPGAKFSTLFGENM